MAAKKATKTAATRRTTRKKEAASGGRKPAKRAAASPAPSSRSKRGGTRVRTPAPASLSSAVSAPRSRELERKPARKAEPRPDRPPAVLPIPQSTFFF